MTYDPPWSTFTLPRRGKAVLLSVKLVDIIEQELENSDRRHLVEGPFRSAAFQTYRQRSVAPSEPDTALGTTSDVELDSNSESDEGVHTPGPSDTELATSEPNMDLDDLHDPSDMELARSEPDLDLDNDACGPAEAEIDVDTRLSDGDHPSNQSIPSPEWTEGFIAHFSPYKLNRRPPSPLADLIPMPNIFTNAHLTSWAFSASNGMTFVDIVDRIGAFFIRPPTERQVWEQTIIDATHVMQRVGRDLDRQGIKGDILRGGFQYAAEGVERPQNFPNTEHNGILLAELQHSQPIKDIISFQNAMLQRLAPRVWDSAHATIDAVMANDLRLHLPFSQLEYHFSIDDSHPIQCVTDHPTGWTALTSVGHYDESETALILWHDQMVVSFPPGSTFLMPGGMVSFSFTGASDRSSSPMLISQSCDGELFRYVQRGMTYGLDAIFTTLEEQAADRRSRAESALAKFPTLNNTTGMPGMRR
ncbi:hypothetical protein B0H13DRAFT_2342685 [Mycena leptocephala]|nr:hypothetical protein B0H13DRAFT_2342685 [Mycena leptocephala]